MNSVANFSCRICHAANSHGQIHHAQEMMFGLREPFDYLECGVCGCLQLLNPPADLSRHYPPNYYSFRRHGRSMRWLRGRWARHAFTGRDRIGALVTRWHGEHQAVTAMARMNAPRNSRILDIGCGHGHFLEDLAFLGFTHLTGIDPFLKTPRPEGPIRLLRAQVHELSETFDIVTLHHAFEHVPEPTVLLNSIRQRLATGGTVIIRIPWAESRLWREFGVTWFQLDAPRHFSLFTRRSLELVAAEAKIGRPVAS